jgi:hypothetical protein
MQQCYIAGRGGEKVKATVVAAAERESRCCHACETSTAVNELVPSFRFIDLLLRRSLSLTEHMLI